jgi:hypothetical protein
MFGNSTPTVGVSGLLLFTSPIVIRRLLSTTNLCIVPVAQQPGLLFTPFWFSFPNPTPKPRDSRDDSVSQFISHSPHEMLSVVDPIVSYAMLRVDDHSKT